MVWSSKKLFPGIFLICDKASRLENYETTQIHQDGFDLAALTSLQNLTANSLFSFNFATLFKKDKKNFAYVDLMPKAVV
jgi:hypothetical protein